MTIGDKIDLLNWLNDNAEFHKKEMARLNAIVNSDNEIEIDRNNIKDIVIPAHQKQVDKYTRMINAVNKIKVKE